MLPTRTLLAALTAAVWLPAAGVARAASADYPYVRNDDIWYRPPGAARPLRITSDMTPKAGPALSADGMLIAYYIAATQGNGLATKLVVVDMGGKKLMEVVPEEPDSHVPYNSISRIEWIGLGRIGVECHINPSLSRYLIVETPDRAIKGAFWGYGFRWSPDRKKLAHVGHILHFAPAAEHSEYLQINYRTVYPRQGKVLSARRPGQTDIHRFVTPFAWSPDSGRVAFVDRVEPAGEEFLVVVYADGHRPRLRRLPSEVSGEKALAWLDSHTIRMTGGRRAWLFDSATAALTEDTVR